MTVYVRVYPGYAIELILSRGRFKKKRIHLLINPNSHVKLGIMRNDEQVSLDSENLTHILYLERTYNTKETFKHTVRLAQILNKPIITNENSAEKLRQEGIPARQIRYFTNKEDVITNFSVEQVDYSLKDYKPEAERVLPSKNLKDMKSNAKSENFLRKFLSLLSPPAFSVYNKISLKIVTPFSTYFEDEKVMNGNSLAIFLHWKKHTFLIPLDKFGMENIEKMSELYCPDTIIFSEIEISKISALELNAEQIVIADEKYAKEKTLQIPKKYNPGFNYNIILGSLMEWIDLGSFGIFK